MAQDFVTVTGLSELQAKLTDSETIDQPVRKMLWGIANHLKEQVQNNMPVDTGAARDSVVVERDSNNMPAWAR